MIILRDKSYSLIGTRLVAGINKKVLGKSAINANRSALQTENKVLGELAKAKTNIEDIALNPGNRVSGYVRDYVNKPVTSLSNEGISMTTGLSMPSISTNKIESTLKNKFPKYNKFTEKASKWYDNNVSGVIENGTNTIINSLKGL